MPWAKLISGLRDGGDYRYGQVFWNTLAFFSWPFWKIWGIHGLIVSNRMVGAILQLLSYWIFLHCLIPDSKKFYRPIGLLLLLLLPTTLYFAHMPKPEPIQLFCLSLFFVFRFSRPKPRLSLFFLGIGLGAKISLLPGCLFILGIELFSQTKQKLKKFLAFLGGLMVGAPIFTYMSYRKFTAYYKTIRINALHGSDREDISWISWIDFFAKEYFSSFGAGLVTLALMTISIIFLLHYIYKKRLLIRVFHDPIIFTFILSMSFLLPTLLFVKRLWPFYLHVGLVLFIVASIRLYANHERTILKKFKYPIIAIMALFIFFRLLPLPAETWRLAHRTQSPEHIAKENLWKKTQKIALQYSSNNIFCIDPNMFYEKRFQNIIIIPFWGPFDFNKHSYCNVILMYDIHLKTDYNKGTKNETLQKKFLEQYKVRVDNSNCSQNCFQRVILPEFPDVIFLLKTRILDKS